MPRTPTQRAHPASAVHPYSNSNPAQPSYDRPPHAASSSASRSPELSRSEWPMKAEQMDDAAKAQSSASGITPSATSNSQPGPSTSSSQSTASSAPTSAPDTKASTTNGSTQQVQAANSTKKKHVCPTCERGFTTSGHLARHARVHTGERNHKCPFPGCETRCSRQDNLQQHYRIHLSPGSRRSASSAARAAAQNKAATAAVTASAIATSPVQTSPVGTLGPDDGPPPLAQSVAGLSPPPQLAHAPQPYSHGPMPYPPTPMTAIPHASPHVQQHTHPGYMPHTPPNGSYEVGQQAQAHQNGLGNGNVTAPPALAHSPPESPASHSHSTPSTGPSAHVPLPPSSYPPHPSYMAYSGYTAGPPGPNPKISTFYQRHHYPPEAYHGAPPSSIGHVSTQNGAGALGTNGGLHPVDQLGEKERRRNRPSISSISSGQSPSQSPIITNGRAERASVGDANAWASASYVSYPSTSGSPATANGTTAAAANGDGSYGIGASNSYAAYAHQHSHPHYDIHSPPPLPPPQSTSSTTSSTSIGSSLLSDGSHTSSHTSYSTLSSHQNQNPNRSPPPILAPIQSSLRGDLGGMGMQNYHAAMPSMRHHGGHGGRMHGHYVPGTMSYTHPQPLPHPHTLTAGAAEGGYAKGYDV